jgi:hypothetical protein
MMSYQDSLTFWVAPTVLPGKATDDPLATN